MKCIGLYITKSIRSFISNKHTGKCKKYIYVLYTYILLISICKYLEHLGYWKYYTLISFKCKNDTVLKFCMYLVTFFFKLLK